MLGGDPMGGDKVQEFVISVISLVRHFSIMVFEAVVFNCRAKGSHVLHT